MEPVGSGRAEKVYRVAPTPVSLLRSKGQPVAGCRPCYCTACLNRPGAVLRDARRVCFLAMTHADGFASRVSGVVVSSTLCVVLHVAFGLIYLRFCPTPAVLVLCACCCVAFFFCDSPRGDPHHDFQFSVLVNYRDTAYPLEIVNVDMLQGSDG